MTQYEILKHYFGYDTFRDGQDVLIQSILEGRDVLGVMPTGAGKSLCYQIPALMMDGITLVISPLISLMKDQVSNLNQVGILAAYINSSLTAAQYYKVLDLARAGRYPIIYVAPERLMSEDFLRFALSSQVKISMVAVDEAHCVSQWGQDFRPSYLKIVDFINQLPERPVVSAFTATATAEVRDDIIDILMLRNPQVMTTGFNRPNLYFGVQSPKDKYATMVNYLERHKGESGIIYCLTRKVVEEVCGQLIREGFSVTRYHAGLSDSERRHNQEDFIYDRAQIMVATNAFGMGIDKSNVRFVVHYNMPKNMESYYQEAGRAGRDGEPSECILLYGGQDVVTNQFFIDHNQDNEALDPITREIVMERDRERLRKMTFYCFTNECLRDYILRYFGEYGSNYCGNCSNCLSQFETVDVTDISRILIGCVESSRQRYGTNVMIDTVHGANTAKIRNYRMDENPHYGELAKVPAYKLRQVMNHLMLNGYLAVTNDEYAIVKLTGKSKGILEEGEPVTMKMAREAEHPAKASGASAGKGRKGRKGLAAGLSGPGGAEFTEADETLFEKLRAVSHQLFNKRALLVSFTADKEGYDVLEKAMDTLIKQMPDEPFVKADWNMPLEKKNEGICCASQIQFVGRTGNYKDAGLPFRGSLLVLQNILNYDYLWIRLRVKGGAYGCMSGFGRDGDCYMVSYLDPKLAETNEVYDKLPEYLEQFDQDERSMDRYVIGAISEMEIPKNPAALGVRGLTAYLSGITREQLQKERDEVIDTDAKEIRALVPYAKAVLSNNCLCVVGNENKIKENSSLFTTVRSL